LPIQVLDVVVLHHENGFHHANNLALHKVASYNRIHWLTQFVYLSMSPPPSSFGGLSPSREFGLFFAVCLSFSPDVLTWRGNFLYNSGLFRICPREKNRESLHSASMRDT